MGDSVSGSCIILKGIVRRKPQGRLARSAGVAAWSWLDGVLRTYYLVLLPFLNGQALLASPPALRKAGRSYCSIGRRLLVRGPRWWAQRNAACSSHITRSRTAAATCHCNARNLRARLVELAKLIRTRRRISFGGCCASEPPESNSQVISCCEPEVESEIAPQASAD